MTTVAMRGNVYFDILKIVKGSPDKEVGGMVVQYQAGGLLNQIHCPVPNVHPSPEHNFAGQAQATIAAYEYTGAFEGAHIAFAWHSHPTTPAVPSFIDRTSYQPADVLLIVSGAGDTRGEMRMWDTTTWSEITPWVVF